MIGSVFIKFKSQGKIKVQGGGEEDLYLLILDVLHKNDKKLVKKIQDSRNERPFTISPLLKGTKSSRGNALFSPDQTACFRVTYLKEKTFESLISGLLFSVNEKESLEFADGEILVERVDWQQGKKASFTSFEEIFSQAQDEKRIILEFCSPTTFENEEERLLPLPKQVFSSLLKKWNTFSEIKLPGQVRDEFKKIGVVQHRLKTEIVHFSKDKTIGFMGKATYELSEKCDEKTRKVVNALSDFSFYSGIGDKTYKGMGQARRLRNPELEKSKSRG